MLFATARVRAGYTYCELELAEPATVADLKLALRESCPALIPLLDSARVAVNACYAADEDWIQPHAEVALIPPVSGGLETTGLDMDPG